MDSLARKVGEEVKTRPNILGATDYSPYMGGSGCKIVVGGRLIDMRFPDKNLGGDVDYDFAGFDASHVREVRKCIEFKGYKRSVNRAYNGVVRFAEKQDIGVLAADAVARWERGLYSIPWLAVEVSEHFKLQPVPA